MVDGRLTLVGAGIGIAMDAEKERFGPDTDSVGGPGDEQEATHAQTL